MFNRDPSNSGKRVPAGVWLVLGVAMGCSLGVAVGNLAMGVGLGAAIGGFLVFVSRRRHGGSGV